MVFSERVQQQMECSTRGISLECVRLQRDGREGSGIPVGDGGSESGPITTERV